MDRRTPAAVATQSIVSTLAPPVRVASVRGTTTRKLLRTSPLGKVISLISPASRPTKVTSLVPIGL